jgi:glycine cleavage system protein P-like pyridoxal-binding family
MTLEIPTRLETDPDLPLIFEQGAPTASAVALSKSDVPAADTARIPAGLLADRVPDLPHVGELDLVRHFTRLSHRVFSIDENFYPLGSCTMKYNPRVNERVAADPGSRRCTPIRTTPTRRARWSCSIASSSFSPKSQASPTSASNPLPAPTAR